MGTQQRRFEDLLRLRDVHVRLMSGSLVRFFVTTFAKAGGGAVENRGTAERALPPLGGFDVLGGSCLRPEYGRGLKDWLRGQDLNL
ncbi:MAG: hypothetical protein ACTHL1_05875 [Burkholderiaceae bacterium]